MKRFLRAIARGLYRYIAKPIMFRCTPDGVHAGMLKFTSTVQSWGWFRWFVEASVAHKDPILRQTVAGIEFQNPVGLSAGFDKNIEVLPIMRSLGFGFMEGGTVTNQVTVGNERPWFHRLPHTKSLVVHVGLANQGVSAIIERIKGYDPKVRSGFPLFVSMAHSNIRSVDTEERMIADTVAGLKKLEKANVASVVTMNISCPNTYGGEPFKQPDALDRLLTAVDGVRLKAPVFVKLPSNLSWSAMRKLLDVMATHNITGVEACNLAKDRSTVDPRDTLDDSIKGGLSGKPVQPLSDALIKNIHATFGDRFVIVGIGGIFSAEDAYAKIKAGASLVQLITGMIFVGPQLVGDINAELARMLRRDGFASIKDAIGADAPKQR